MTWLFPFLVSLGIYNAAGLLLIDLVVFKTIMILSGALAGTLAMVKYFKGISSAFLTEGIFIGILWLLINWLLDVAFLMPLSGMHYIDYFLEIGLRYLIIPLQTIGTGYLLTHQLRSERKL